MATHSARKHSTQFAHEPQRADQKGRKSDKASPSLRTRLHGRFFLGSLAVLGSVILLNALALQKEQHPSPLFQPIQTAKSTQNLAPTRQEQASLAQIAKQSVEPTSPAMAAPSVTTPSSLPPAVPYQPQPLPHTQSKDALTERILNAEKQKPNVAPQSDSDTALIMELQRELSKRGHYKGEIDGKSGPMMVQAIRSFQFSQRVAVDGKPTEALLRDVRKTKTTGMKEELLDLLQKTTSSSPASPPSSLSQRPPNKAG